MARRYPWPFVRTAAVATALLATVYLAGARGGHQVLVLPYYLLVVGFDVLELLVGPAGEFRSLLVGAYLLVLGTLCVAALRLARRAVASEGRAGAGRDDSPLRLGVAAPLLAVAALALLLALAVGVGTGQREPLWIAGGAGLAALGLALLVAGVPQRAIRARRRDLARGRK